MRIAATIARVHTTPTTIPTMAPTERAACVDPLEGCADPFGDPEEAGPGAAVALEVSAGNVVGCDDFGTVREKIASSLVLLKPFGGALFVLSPR